MTSPAAPDPGPGVVDGIARPSLIAPRTAKEPMVGIDEVVERSGALKRELLAFARRPQFERALKRELRRQFGDPVVAEEGELENFFDWFIQQYRRPDGRTLVDCFLKTRPDLPDPEQEFLRGWRDVVEGIFEVVGRDGPALVTVNLIDDLEYRMRANVGPSIFDRLPAGSFLGTRVVPVGGQWLLSGMSAQFGAHERDSLMRVVAETAMRHPELVFRNPERLARGWELQRADRSAFVEHFGTDTVVLDRADLPEQLRAFSARRHADSPAGEDWVRSIVAALHPAAETAGLIYDETDGLGVYADYRLAQEAFADPDLARNRTHRTLLKNYLTDDSVSPVPLVRLAERDHGKADRVFRRLTGKPSFTWADDGEALLRRHKPTWYAHPPLPRTIVIGDHLVPYVAG